MNQRDFDDLSHLSMTELFRVEAENQAAILTAGLLDLERGAGAAQTFEMLMRAAHSLKGAARIINLRIIERLAHALEDCFVAAQHGKLVLRQPEIDTLFRGLDLIGHLGKLTEAGLASWEAAHTAEIGKYLEDLAKLVRDRSQSAGVADGRAPVAAQAVPEPHAPTEPRPAPATAQMPHVIARRSHEASERVVRLTAENLNRLLGLAAESLAESRWLGPFSESLRHLRQRQADLAQELDSLRGALAQEEISNRAQNRLTGMVRKIADCQRHLDERLQELDHFGRRSGHLSQRLYQEVLRTRMRPFSDGVRRFPRMVRDLARSLGKEVTLEIHGETTQVDRDILERLETPLAHLLHNAVDHGCESRAERERAGKPPEGVIRLEARHSAGALLVTVSDDGAGVPLERLRRAIVLKKLALPSAAERLAESELLEYLFVPGMTLKETVTEISGRGVGLDVVQNMAKSLRGTIRLTNQPGRGLRVQMQLPLTLSVVRALLVEIAGEPYALPLSQVTRAVILGRGQVQTLEGRPHFDFGGQSVGLLSAQQLLECGKPLSPGRELSVVVLGDRNTRYGLIVDRFMGERELVAQPLDARLGRVKHINSAAVMEDGTPVLIVDVDDMFRSIEHLVSTGRLGRVAFENRPLPSPKQKRVLAVDDSLTVRELERKLIAGHGYHAEVAVDGVDGWNAVRKGHYDLVITDVDMPGMDGFELATLIKQDPKLKSLLVMIVSYKDAEEDRLRSVKAGADCYLAKESFQDDRLLQAVVDLIGEPEE